MSWNNTQIEWTERTWNWATGCNKVTEGCRNCYAHTVALDLQRKGSARYKNGFTLTVHEDLIDEPLRHSSPAVVFVCSMSDWLHHDIPEKTVMRVIEVMREAKRHTFQVLTKREMRLQILDRSIDWPDNVHVGVTVENWQNVHRIGALRSTHAKIKFLSMEPLISPIKKEELILDGIDWVIVGGESGIGCRQINPDWVRTVRDKCAEENVPFFFKQWGGPNKRHGGKMLDGRFHLDMPGFKILAKHSTNYKKDLEAGRIMTNDRPLRAGEIRQQAIQRDAERQENLFS